MTTLALVLLLLVAAMPLALPLLEARVRARIDPVLVVAALSVALLAVAAVIATSADAASGWERVIAPALAVVVATSAGSPVVRAVFRLMRREFVPAARATTAPAVEGAPEAPPETVLRGGAWIGYLERAAAAVSILAGFPEGLAIVLGVKGVGRYSELRETNAPEAFIIGTMASMLWAVAAAGTGHLLG